MLVCILKAPHLVFVETHLRMFSIVFSEQLFLSQVVIKISISNDLCLSPVCEPHPNNREYNTLSQTLTHTSTLWPVVNLCPANLYLLAIKGQ